MFKLNIPLYLICLSTTEIKFGQAATIVLQFQPLFHVPDRSRRLLLALTASSRQKPTQAMSKAFPLRSQHQLLFATTGSGRSFALWAVPHKLS